MTQSTSKLAHLEMGRVLMASGDSAAAIEHLKRGFTEGDNHYEAQFWYARELFLQCQFADANKRFIALNDQAPGRFRTRSAAPVVRNGIPVQYECRVARKEEGYAFLALSQFPSDVFASRAESNLADWDQLYTGANAQCGLGFSRRGVRSIFVRLAL